MPVYEVLEQIMEERSLKVADIARQCDIPDSTVRGIIKRKQDTIALDVAWKLSDGLGISLERLNGMQENRRDRNKKAPLYSSEAMKIARDYDALDHWGKMAVRGLADTELARMEDEKQFMDNTMLEQEPKIINLFDNPSAAGPALDVTGQGCQPYALTSNDPQGASYAVRVQGDSMEPYFPDGSIAFVNHDQMRDGDVGIFCVDGATVIKQWHYDRGLGITYLFSLNRKRSDADLVITSNSGRSLVWQGRVLTRQRFDLPGI